MIIGSTAMRYWYPDFKREPKDLDKAVRNRASEGVEEGGKIEKLWNPVLFQYYPDHKYLSPKGLLTLKMSHLFWDINWDKHMFDIQFLLKKGIKHNQQLFNDLYEFWNNHVHNENKRSDLAMNAQEFFDNAITCPIPHDDLHLLIKNPPTFTKVLKDGAEVAVDENKFNALSFEEKMDLVREEVYVMAYERFGNLKYKIAYRKMLRKFIMSHAPMWEAIFIIYNYIELHTPVFNFIQHIKHELQTNYSGTV